MAIYKNKDIETNIKATHVNIGNIGAQFYSEDTNSASIRIYIKHENKPVNLLTTGLKPVLSLSMEDGSYFDNEPLDIVMPEQGLIQYKIRDNVIKHIGQVKATLKLMSETQSLHASEFSFTILSSGSDEKVAKEINIDLIGEKIEKILSEKILSEVTNKLLEDKSVNASRVKGGNISVFGNSDFNTIYEDVKRLNLNVVTLPILVNANSLTDSNPYVVEQSLNKVKEVVPQLTKVGVKIILEPYPYIDDGKGIETEWNPDNKEQWFESWGNILNDLGIYAENNKVYGIYIASNLVRLEHETQNWIDLINNFRSVYSGKVIYRTNYWVTASWATELKEAYDNKLNNDLFGLVDIIAISSYFELTDKINPSVEDLKENIYNVSLYGRGQNIYEEIKAFNEKWNKPIMFGELGIPPYETAPSQPWNNQFNTEYNEDIQANWFKAWYEVFSPNDWFLGFSIYAIADTNTTYKIQEKTEEIMYSLNFGGKEQQIKDLDNKVQKLEQIIQRFISSN